MEQDNTNVDSNAEGAPTHASAAPSPFTKSSKNRPYWMRTDGAAKPGATADPSIVPPGLAPTTQESLGDGEAIPSDAAGMSIADSPFPRAKQERWGGRSGQRPLSALDDVEPAPGEPTEPEAPAQFEPRRMSEGPVSSNVSSVALAPLNFDYGTFGQSVTRKEMVSRKSYVTQQYLKAAAIANSQAKRPWYQRLTPFSWALFSAAGVAFIAGMVYAASIVARAPQAAPQIDDFASSNGNVQRVAQVLPAATVTATAIVEPTAVATFTAVPVPTEAPTATPTVEPQPTPDPTAEPAPTVELTAEAAAVPAPVATADIVPWAGSMLQPSNGVFMAPENVVAEVQSSVGGYYAALRQHRSPSDATRDLVTNQDTFLSQYFAGDALKSVKNDLNTADELGVLERGDVTVKVLSFSPDGSSAMVMVEQRGFTTRFWQKPQLARWQLRRQPDQDVRLQVDYSISDQRWRVTSILETTAVQRPSRSVSGNRAPVTRSRPSRQTSPVTAVATASPADTSAAPDDAAETTEQAPVEIPTPGGAAITP
jgi:hypothetical protein